MDKNKKLMREEFKKLVIMALYPECETYKEAGIKDGFMWLNPTNIGVIYTQPVITIGRVMQALENPLLSFSFGTPLKIQLELSGEFITEWQLTKDGKELCDDDQSDETIKKLYKLLK